MSSRCVVLDQNNNALYLTGAKYDDQGNVISGYVENGAWDYRVTITEELAKDGRVIVNRWPRRSNLIVIDVPKDIHGDYNEVIDWAIEVRNLRGT